MTRTDFDHTIERQHRALVRFAGYLGANRLLPGVGVDAARDMVHDTVERLVHTEAYERYAYEPHATRIPAWLRRALEFTILAERQRLRRRNSLVAKDIEARAHVGDLLVAVQGGDTEDGFAADGNLELSVRQPGALGMLVNAEEAAHQVTLQSAMAAELAKIEPATAAGMRLVLGEERSWAEASAATGVPAEALRKRVTRAIPGLRERILAAVSDSAVSRTL